MSANQVTIDNVSISAENVISANVNKLTVDTEVVTNLSSINLSANDLTAGQILVGLSNLNLADGTVISSAAQISSNFQNQIDKTNDNVEELSGDYVALKDKINNTMASEPLSAVRNDANPDYLLLRDVDDERYLYALQVKSGRLTIKLVKFVSN